MFGNSPMPTNMRFPPPPPFFPIPPITNPMLPQGWRPAPPVVHQHPPPWSNSHIQSKVRMPEGSGFQMNRYHVPVGPSNLSYMPQDVTTPQKSQEESDNDWIKNFFQRCAGEKSEKMKHQVVKLSEAKQLHMKAYKLLQTLQDGCQSESDAKSLLDSTVKKELDKILHVLNDDEYVAKVATTALRRKRKRARSKIRRQEHYIKRSELQDLIQQKHILVDKWLEDRKKVEHDLKRERKVRKDLDEYLSGVRQKQQNAQRYLNLFNAMAKLRKARCETAIRKGQSPPSETHNDVFKAAHNSACKRLRDFISECKREENFMKKYLTEEHEAEERRIQEKLNNEKEKKVLEWKAERSQVLFGPEGDSDTSDPMWTVRETHSQGPKSLVGLVNIRAQWDHFINDTGSKIPSHWVEPSLPSSDEWQNYLSI